MNCPNCNQPFTEERAEKFFCSTCGWLEKVGKEWKSCDAPESQAPQESPDPPPEPDHAAHEPDPAAHEPDPAALEPDPAAHSAETLEETQARVNPPGVHNVKKLFGGLVTITKTETDE